MYVWGFVNKMLLSFCKEVSILTIFNLMQYSRILEYEIRYFGKDNPILVFLACIMNYPCIEEIQQQKNTCHNMGLRKLKFDMDYFIIIIMNMFKTRQIRGI